VLDDGDDDEGAPGPSTRMPRRQRSGRRTGRRNPHRSRGTKRGKLTMYKIAQAAAFNAKIAVWKWFGRWEERREGYMS